MSCINPSPILKDFEKELKNAFSNYNASVDAITGRAFEVDKSIFKVYDFISKVICGHRSIIADDCACDVVRSSDYLELLEDFEYVYSKIKELL